MNKKDLAVGVALAVVGGALCLSAWATAPFNDTISTTSIQLVAKKPTGSTAWSAIAVSQGDVVKASNGVYYFCVDAGTAANEPTHSTGEVTGADSVTWRFISKNRRNGVIITVLDVVGDGGAVNLSFGDSAAVKDFGLLLVGQGATFFWSPADNYQGEIHAISQTGSNVTVCVQEF